MQFSGLYFQPRVQARGASWGLWRWQLLHAGLYTILQKGPQKERSAEAMTTDFIEESSPRARLSHVDLKQQGTAL